MRAIPYIRVHFLIYFHRNREGEKGIILCLSIISENLRFAVSPVAELLNYRTTLLIRKAAHALSVLPVIEPKKMRAVHGRAPMTKTQ